MTENALDIHQICGEMSASSTDRPYVLNQLYQFFGLTRRLFGIRSEVTWSEVGTPKEKIVYTIQDESIPKDLHCKYFETINCIKANYLFVRVDDIEWLREK